MKQLVQLESSMILGRIYNLTDKFRSSFQFNMLILHDYLNLEEIRNLRPGNGLIN